MTRDWIITVLRGLPVWCWPVFLWDVMRVRAWWQALPIRADALMTLGVTRHGRIVVTGVYEGDVPPAEEGWTAYAPRRPWLVLDPQRRAHLVAVGRGTTLFEPALPGAGRTFGLATPAPTYEDPG